jgi:alpha-N-acetylglucosamine transferase
MHTFNRKRLFAAVGLVILLVCILIHSLLQTRGHIPRDYSKEAYVTLLNPNTPHPWDNGLVDYDFETVLILSRVLLRNPTTRDPFHRPLIVLVSSNVPNKQKRSLRSHGCVVKVIPPAVGKANVDHLGSHQEGRNAIFQLWNMTEYSRLAFFDSNTLPVQRVDRIFEIHSRRNGGDEWLFAAVNDQPCLSYPDQFINKPSPSLAFNTNVFVLMPTESQAQYISSAWQDGSDIDSRRTWRDMLQWSYRRDGPFPWLELSRIYNTPSCQRPVFDDGVKIWHGKLWNASPGADEELRTLWYNKWGEVAAEEAMRKPNRILQWNHD